MQRTTMTAESGHTKIAKHYSETFLRRPLKGREKVVTLARWSSYPGSVGHVNIIQSLYTYDSYLRHIILISALHCTHVCYYHMCLGASDLSSVVHAPCTSTLMLSLRTELFLPALICRSTMCGAQCNACKYMN